MKALVQLVGAMLAVALPHLMATDDLSLTEWINVGAMAVGAAVVYISANLYNEHPAWKYTKAILSGVAAVGVLLVSVLGDNVISPSEWWQIGAAFLTAAGVLTIPNIVAGAHARA